MLVNMTLRRDLHEGRVPPSPGKYGLGDLHVSAKDFNGMCDLSPRSLPQEPKNSTRQTTIRYHLQNLSELSAALFIQPRITDKETGCIGTLAREEQKEGN